MAVRPEAAWPGLQGSGSPPQAVAQQWHATGAADWEPLFAALQLRETL